MTTKDNPSSAQFERSSRVWFPDFEEAIETMERRCGKYAVPFDAMLAMLRYFRTEITRQQFLSLFFAQNPPEKLLPSDRRKYLRAKEICTAYQNHKICGTELDEQLLVCFRDRPVDDVFVPPFEAWEDMKLLLSRLEKKSERLPIHFDGTAWRSYLRGIVTRQQYVQCHLEWGTGDHLAQLLAYGDDKEAFAATYRMEIDVCMGLRKLCMDYKDGLLSPDDFDSRFLQLARAFCSDISQ